MSNTEIKQRISAVMDAMNALTISGVQNASIIAGCFQILHELQNSIPEDEKSGDGSAA